MMLPRRDRALLRCLLLCGLLLVVPLTARPAHAQNATEKVPADAAFFTAMLRNREQVEGLVKSKGFKRLSELPLVKMGLAQLHAMMAKPGGGPMDGIMKLLEAKENKELLQVLHEAVSDEIFIYGGKSLPEMLALAQKTYNSASFAPLQALIGGGDPTKAQLRTVFKSLAANKAKVRVPDLVFGFKVKDTKKVEDQIRRLDKLAEALAAKAPPLKGRVRRQAVDGSSFLTVNLDGSLLPWEELPLGDIEDRPGEFKDIVDHLKNSKLTVSLGVHSGYLLLGISPTTADITRIGGKESSLASREELKPLVADSKKKLTSISYTSKAMYEAISGSPGDLKALAVNVKEMLKSADLPAARKAAIEKDIDEFVTEASAKTPELGASLAYEYMNDKGYAGRIYDYADHKRLRKAQLKLLEHFGGNPIYAAGVATASDGSGYNFFSKYVKKAYGHADAILLDKLGPDERAQYTKFRDTFVPLIERLDKITRTQLIPATKDCNIGLVLDGKWTSKTWHKDMPPLDKATAMPELGFLLGVADGPGFAKAMREYRLTLNEIIEKGRDVAPKENIPEFRIPAAETEKGAAGTLYFYPIPEMAGLDKQVVPVLGVGSKVVAFTFSKAHANRLLSPRPLVVKDGPLAEKRPLVAAVYFNGPGLIDLAEPWVEFSIRSAAGKDAAAILPQATVVLDVMRSLRRYSSATYINPRGHLVTETETIIEDR